MKFKKLHREKAIADDNVLCKIVLDINQADGGGPNAGKAIGGLGVFEYTGCVTPEQAHAILAIISPVKP